MFLAPESYQNLKFSHDLIKDKIFYFGDSNTFGRARNLLANGFRKFRNNRAPAVSIKAVTSWETAPISVRMRDASPESDQSGLDTVRKPTYIMGKDTNKGK